MGALVDYWYYTGDDSYNDIAQEGLLFQTGPNKDYMPPNQTMTEGNDDQGFWGMAVMSAAEYNFQNPPDDKPQWLALAQAVFNTQAARWDTKECGGGLRWQIFTWNKGYNYKNSISQACFFNIAARLALYTGNQTYAEWADKTWDWMVQTRLIDPNTYAVVDGMHVEDCSQLAPYQWSYNVGAFLLGAAAMYNHSADGHARDAWHERVDGLLNRTGLFFKNGVMTEVTCEPVGSCNDDQKSFKAYLSRWMAATTKWAPWTYDKVKPVLASSASAAASQCTSGGSGRLCGLKWTDKGVSDGSTGIGQQMAAMEVVLANMIQGSSAPVTHATGGTSGGDAGAGGSDVGRTDPWSILDSYPPITAADRAGAAILTILALAGLVAGVVFMFLDETSTKAPAQRWSDFQYRVATGAAAGAAGAAALARGEKVGLRHRYSDAYTEEAKMAYRSGSDSASPTSAVFGAGAANRSTNSSPTDDETGRVLPIREPSSRHHRHRSTGSGTGLLGQSPTLPPMVARGLRTSGSGLRNPLRRKP